MVLLIILGTALWVNLLLSVHSGTTCAYLSGLILGASLAVAVIVYA